jgi:hypothetical protein
VGIDNDVDGLACLLAGAVLRLRRRNGANLSGNR